jgi:glucan biosynthesis protein C
MGSPRLKAIAVFALALYAWTMTFALTGLFLRIASKARPWARYLSDSSYWCYLAHLPLLMALQVLVAGWQLPGGLKAWLVIAAASAILLVSYEFFVRYTWLGALLNGTRRRPISAAAAVTPTS